MDSDLCSRSLKICLPTKNANSMPMLVPIVATRKPHQKPNTAETSSMTGVEEINSTGNTAMAASAIAAT